MKLLLTVNNAEINPVSVNFACYLANLSRSKLTGLFLEERPHETLEEAITSINGQEPAKPCDEKNIIRFTDACVARDTTYAIHKDKCISADELILETRFADLLIIDAKMSFADNKLQAPTKLVKKVLAGAECPVIVSPESDSIVTEILFAYDGSASAVFAMKQFSYLLPHFKNTKLTIVEASKTGRVSHKKYKIQEWAQEHYSNVNFKVLPGDEENRLLELLLGRANTLVIMGAYGREGLSAMFKKSHAEPIIKVITQPIFIAHQ